MAKKRHHMTKHQYKAYKNNHRQYKHAFDVEEENVEQRRSQYTKSKKKSEENMRNLLRDVQENVIDFLNEETDDVHDRKVTKTLGSVEERETRLKELEQ